MQQVYFVCKEKSQDTLTILDAVNQRGNKPFTQGGAKKCDGTQQLRQKPQTDEQTSQNYIRTLLQQVLTFQMHNRVGCSSKHNGWSIYKKKFCLVESCKWVLLYTIHRFLIEVFILNDQHHDSSSWRETTYKDKIKLWRKESEQKRPLRRSFCQDCFY